MSFARAVATVGGLTALSRLAGFARDVLLAAALGAGPVADAFFVSLKLANFLRRLFAEGAFSVAFVPLHARVAAERGLQAARRFAGEALVALALALGALVLLGELLMPWLVRGLATGFPPGSPTQALAVELNRLTFPYLLFAALAALLSAVLQAARRFAAAAAAPLLLNLVLVAALLASGATGEPAARLLAACVALAGLLQLLWVWAAARRAGLAPRPAWPRPSPELRRLARLAAPSLLGVGVVQVNLLVSSWFATHLPPGAVAHLFYADRLVQLPLGVVGVALGTALLPALSQADRRRSAGSALLNRALELALLLGLPAAVGLGLLAEPIVSVLFERGAFGPEAARSTAAVLAGLALGLPAYVLAKVLAPGFFAAEDASTPLRVAGVALAVNAGGAWALAGPWGGFGVALALSLASWVNALGLGLLLWRRGALVPDADLARRAAATLGAVAAMGLVLAAARGGLPAEPGALPLAGLIAAGAAAFLAAAWTLGAVDAGALRALRSTSRA